MNANAALFAIQFNLDFVNATIHLGASEIALFRELSKCLKQTSKNIQVEEYHGTAHQVTFKGDSINARVNARCELSDLMIIIFSSDHKQVRLTYVQAKSERTLVNIPHKTLFKGNTEQWFLLSKRPSINGCGTFNPPKDLLSSTILPSIGSFIFFFRIHPKTDCQMFYVIADYLNVIKNNKNNNGKLTALGHCKLRQTKTFQEITSTCSNFDFAYNLYDYKIGSPIVENKKIVVNNSVRKWLASGLNTLIVENNGDNTELCKELLGIIGGPDSDNKSTSLGAKTILILKTEAENETI